MPLNLPLPDWVPWWGQLVVLVVAILFGFALLMMPFSVFGLKGRLDFLEAQLDDIHAELRMLAMRLPDPARVAVREPVFEELSTRPGQERAPSPTQRPRADLEPRADPLPRRPAQADDWTPRLPDRDEEDAPSRRPLRATTLRDPGREAGREAGHGRSEPTLRWPSPR
jgi:hypothetical protein